MVNLKAKQRLIKEIEELVYQYGVVLGGSISNGFYTKE